MCPPGSLAPSAAAASSAPTPSVPTTPAPTTPHAAAEDGSKAPEPAGGEGHPAGRGDKDADDDADADDYEMPDGDGPKKTISFPSSASKPDAAVAAIAASKKQQAASKTQHAAADASADYIVADGDDDVYDMPDEVAATAAAPSRIDSDDIYEAVENSKGGTHVGSASYGHGGADAYPEEAAGGVYEDPMTDTGLATPRGSIDMAAPAPPERRGRRLSHEFPAAHRNSLEWFVQVASEDHPAGRGDDDDDADDDDYEEPDPNAFAEHLLREQGGNPYAQSPVVGSQRGSGGGGADRDAALRQGGYNPEAESDSGSDYENSDVLGLMLPAPSQQPGSNAGGNAPKQRRGSGGQLLNNAQQPPPPGEWKEKFLPGQLIGRGLTQKYEEDKQKRLEMRRKMKGGEDAPAAETKHAIIGGDDHEDFIDL